MRFRSRMLARKDSRWPVCARKDAANSHGHTMRPEIAMCNMVTLRTATAPVERIVSVSSGFHRWRRPETNHQVTVKIIENGTNDSFASAPSNPQSGNSQSRRHNKLQEIASRKQPSAESIRPDKRRFEVSKLSKYKLAARSATESFQTRRPPMATSKYAV